MGSPLIIDFVASLTLIVAIGAQNAFILRQGLAASMCWRGWGCAVSDILLITAGIAGISALIVAHPGALDIARFGGAVFLIGYGLLAARRALRPARLTPSEKGPARLLEVLVTCLAST